MPTRVSQRRCLRIPTQPITGLADERALPYAGTTLPGSVLAELRHIPARSSPVTWCTRSDPSWLVGQAREGLEIWFGHLLVGGGVDGLGAGEDVESEVAAAFGPFVVLLGQDGADEPDDAGTVGKDADHV